MSMHATIRMNIKKGQLRVWHIPQILMDDPFRALVPDIKVAALVYRALANYDLFQFTHMMTVEKVEFHPKDTQA